MLKVNKKTVERLHFTSFRCVYLLFLNMLHTLLISFYFLFQVGKCQLQKVLKIFENENDILRLNDLLDFIIIIFTLIFIIQFYFVFIVISFSNLYFWIIKVSVPLSKIIEENAFSSPPQKLLTFSQSSSREVKKKKKKNAS